MTSKPTTIGTFDMGTSLQIPRHQQIVTIETEAELCCGNPARWSTRLKFVQICGALVALRPTILASEWVAARIGRSEMGEGPTNPSFNSRVKLFGTPGLRPELDFFLLGNGLTGLGLDITLPLFYSPLLVVKSPVHHPGTANSTAYQFAPCRRPRSRRDGAARR